MQTNLIKKKDYLKLCATQQLNKKNINTNIPHLLTMPMLAILQF